ncbi:hypothetical protein KKC97_00840 [bacterium]|nr:hypothetical protein [bacterium]MBU1920111.1 hypothetical protein [bacterium]
MNDSLSWQVLALIMVFVSTVYGEEPELRFQLKSATNQCEYDIKVVMPAGGGASDAGFPVVYCMDWYILGDYLEALPKMMVLGRLVEPYILVGITQGSTAGDWAVMRTRDYTPAQPIDEYSKSNMYQEALELAGGADKFSAFIRSELIPKIESEFPADSARRCFVGYSLGSLLGVYLLETDPQLFQYYLLGSPSLWYNEYYLTDELEQIPPYKFDEIERVYVSVGEDESWEMLKSYDLLRSALNGLEIEDSKLKFEIISSSGHVGAMPISLYNGLRFLFGNK